MNRLANEASPYLQLHKNDPVDWHVWGQEAFAAAEAANKPIMLSIGYTACHWCHVMQEESFADAATAEQLNRDFVCIKVDKEERPDVDQLYQAAANLMGHNGGWPLTMFLTPQLIPYGAGTYFPKEERAGQQPPLRAILTEAVANYREKHDAVVQTTNNVMRELTSLFYRDMRGPLDAGSLDSAAVRVAQRFDIFFGGLTGQIKFPSVTLLEVMWRGFLRTGTAPFLQLISTTLDHMLLGGVYDHVGGGFHRYAQDERWLVPHWEKMLFDQAQILEIMTGLWQFNRNKLCEVRVAETVDFVLRDMRNGGAFASSIHSDSDGEEGKYYLWTEAEIDAALMGTYTAKFKSAYNVTREGNFSGRNILHRVASQSAFPQSDADEALFTKQRQLLLAARQKRTAPFRDDKVMADWNGLMIAALAEVAAVFERSDWMKSAVEAFDAAVRMLGDGDRLHHCWIDGKRSGQAFADDYAQMARAALLLHEHLGDARYLDQARAWVRILNEHYWDAQKGGYCVIADDAEPLIVRARAINDNPTPSTNGTMLAVLSRLSMITADPQYHERLNALIGVFAGEAMRVFISCGAYFNGLEFGLTNLNLVVIGPANHPRTHELKMAVLGRALPNRLLTVAAPEYEFPPAHPMHGKGMQDGQPTAYLVQRGLVSPPITNPVALSQMLQLPQQRRAQAVPAK